MEKSFPFNAKYAGSSFDRVYSADDWAAERAAYISDGILTQAALAVTPGGGMSVCVASGQASIGGRTYFNTEPLVKPLSSSSAVRQRIDLVVLRLDTEAREMYVTVKSSSFSADPVAPTCTVTETVTEIPLAEVRVGVDATEITAADITDRRVLAKYPLNYDKLYEDYLVELKERLGLESLSDVGIFTEMLTVTGGGTKALFDDGTYKDVPRIVTGVFHLLESTDGTVDVALGFRPKAVYFCRQSRPTAAYEDGTMHLYGGLVLDGFPCCSRYDAVTEELISLAEITDTGFRVLANRENNTGYHYMGATFQYGGVGGGVGDFSFVYMAIV